VTSSVIALAADHAGFALKNSMKVVLDEHGFPLVDLGPETADPVDYPDMAGKLADALKGWPRAAGAAAMRHRHRHLPSRLTAIPGFGSPCAMTPQRRVWRASTTTPTFLRSARA
jgi:Ribose/Galactose Isomerase